MRKALAFCFCISAFSISLTLSYKSPAPHRGRWDPELLGPRVTRTCFWVEQIHFSSPVQVGGKLSVGPQPPARTEVSLPSSLTPWRLKHFFFPFFSP